MSREGGKKGKGGKKKKEKGGKETVGISIGGATYLNLTSGERNVRRRIDSNKKKEE